MHALGDLTVGAAVHISVQQTEASCRLQRLQAVPQAAKSSLPRQFVTVVVPQSERGLCVIVRCDRLIQPCLASTIADLVQCCMTHHAIDPTSAGATAGVKAGCTVPDRHECVVQHILSSSTITHNAQGNAEQVARFALIDAAQCITIAMCAGLQCCIMVKRFFGESGRWHEKISGEKR
ncbi:hypothetical protein AX13_05115 [Comamonas aquatica DA1877]|uniref:Uncharacterized protein n=1 Tax=Comamonas aquatica DA1877 TaxID=1457173 RepID=A0A014NJ80_9BURK|nr:hypothetical protein AX13_05115 [Comamonas aquatica DA1877]